MPISDAPPSDRARLDQAHCADREAAYQQAIREVRCTQCGAAPGHRCIGGDLVSQSSHFRRVQTWRSR